MHHRPKVTNLHYGVVVGRSFLVGKSWRTSRPARHKSNVSVLPVYCAAVVLRAFFVKVGFFLLTNSPCGAREKEETRARTGKG